MTALALVGELRAAGISLAVDGDRLVARGRHLPVDLADRLRVHKVEVVAFLRAEAAPGDLVASLAVACLAEPPTGTVAEAVEDAAVSVTRALRDAGWIVVYSTILAAEVIFTRDAGVLVPEAYAALPRFDRDELAVLAEDRPDAERLRAICDVKREMTGSRVVRDMGNPVTPDVAL